MKLVRVQGLSKIIVDNQIKDEKKFQFEDELDVEDQRKIIVSQVDIEQVIKTRTLLIFFYQINTPI